MGSTIFTSGPCRNRLVKVLHDCVYMGAIQHHPIKREPIAHTQSLLSLDSMHLGHMHVRAAYEAQSQGKRDVSDRGQEGAQYSTWALYIQKFRKKKSSIGV